MIKNTIYINKQYRNIATLDVTMDEDIDVFSNISWLVLIRDILSDSLLSESESESESESDINEYLIDNYGICYDQLNDYIGEDGLHNYYNEISFYFNMFAGSNAKLYDLVLSLRNLIDIGDFEKVCNLNGVLWSDYDDQTPMKVVYVVDDNAAKWLQRQFVLFGINVECKFV